MAVLVHLTQLLDQPFITLAAEVAERNMMAAQRPVALVATAAVVLGALAILAA